MLFWTPNTSQLFTRGSDELICAQKLIPAVWDFLIFASGLRVQKHLFSTQDSVPWTQVPPVSNSCGIFFLQSPPITCNSLISLEACLRLPCDNCWRSQLMRRYWTFKLIFVFIKFWALLRDRLESCLYTSQLGEHRLQTQTFLISHFLLWKVKLPLTASCKD